MQGPPRVISNVAPALSVIDYYVPTTTVLTLSPSIHRHVPGWTVGDCYKCLWQNLSTQRGIAEYDAYTHMSKLEDQQSELPTARLLLTTL